MYHTKTLYRWALLSGSVQGSGYILTANKTDGLHGWKMRSVPLTNINREIANRREGTLIVST